jgi:hypothetical protein
MTNPRPTRAEVCVVACAEERSGGPTAEGPSGRERSDPQASEAHA